MKKTVLSLIPVLAIMLVSLSVAAPTVYAASCGVDSNGEPIETSVDLTAGGAFSDLCNSEGANPISALLLWAISLMGAGVGIAVVIGIIYGGIVYAMSDGDSGKAKEGQEIIVNAIIGLFLFIFLYAGANFLIPGGLFTSP